MSMDNDDNECRHTEKAKALANKLISGTTDGLLKQFRHEIDEIAEKTKERFLGELGRLVSDEESREFVRMQVGMFLTSLVEELPDRLECIINTGVARLERGGWKRRPISKP